jgi:ATP-binding cassette subfamily C protein LapB
MSIAAVDFSKDQEPRRPSPETLKLAALESAPEPTEPQAEQDESSLRYSLEESSGLLNPVDALEEIARSWFGYSLATGLGGIRGSIPSPETLADIAGELGLVVAVQERTVKSLRAEDFPCLILNHAGLSRIILDRPDARSFRCQSAGETYDLRRLDLEQDHSGLIVLVRPADESDPAAADESATTSMPEDPAVNSIIALLTSAMLKRRTGTLLQLILAAAVGNLLLVTMPIFSMAVYDRVLPHLAFETLWALSIGMAVVLLADLGLRYVRMKLIDSIAADIGHSVLTRFYRRLVHGKLTHTPRTGGALAQATRDIEAYSQLIPGLFLAVLVDIPFIVFSTAILAGIAGMIAFVPIGGGLLIALIYLIAHLAGHAKLAPYLALMRQQSGMVIETVDGLETIKTSGAENVMLNRWERLSDATALGSHQSRMANGFAAQAAMTVSQSLTMVVLILGVFEISENLMTVGALTASTMLLGRLVSPITQFIAQGQRLMQMRKTLEPIRAVLNLPLEQTGDRQSLARGDIRGAIQVKNVNFSYPRAHAPSLTEISLTIRPGERIGIIGRVGSGKSTLLRLLTRLNEPDTGTILLDGFDIRQTSPQRLRHAFALMQQEARLFDDTLYANLTFGLDQLDPRQFETAARLSGVAAFAARTPEGYSMRIGPHGERLSGGERQAVALARAMMGNPQMLLLDEPTAAMDNTSEQQIIGALRTWLTGRTLIVSTHRAAMLDLVDRVILMHDGKIVADGPKETVLRQLQTPTS